MADVARRWIVEQQVCRRVWPVARGRVICMRPAALLGLSKGGGVVSFCRECVQVHPDRLVVASWHMVPIKGEA